MNIVNNRFAPGSSHVLEHIYNPPSIVETSDRLGWPKDRKIDLPTPYPTLSHWAQAFRHRLDHYVSSPAVAENADVVIIGSGLTGCSAALHILQENPRLNVVMLEARAFCSGSTGRNGGHIGRPDGFDFQADWETVGKEKYMEARAFHKNNQRAMLEHIYSRRLTQQISLTFTGGVQIFGSQKERDTTLADLAFMESVGVPHQTKVFSKEEMAEEMECENLYGGIYAQESGSFWPRKFCAALIDEVLEKHPEQFKLYTHTYATKIKPVAKCKEGSSGPRWEVATTRGSIKAGSVLHATNAWLCALLPELLHTHDEVLPDKEMVIAARPTPKPGSKGTWRCNVMASNGFHYLCQMPQEPGDSRENVIIYGLAEERNNSDDSTLPLKQATHMHDMSRFLAQAFPVKFTAQDSEGRISADSVENVWAGLIGRTRDGSVIVGPVRDKKGQYTAAGYNGAGMAKCFLTGKAIADMIAWELRSGGERSSEQWQPPSYYPQWFFRNLDCL